ncbi:pentatricopeptide repeat-containing protein At4g18840-like [Chenopodium quinoa]|uniref:pentatricopeptide repeat-containing protein At4g18840-like n=1 Tax=Chenopodium quinoa TaxID=63459 RepID=UPI000B776212|nr:pentatricopeptide repeat-containing protein At4g18840-like [Chenopodium quinoa]
MLSKYPNSKLLSTLQSCNSTQKLKQIHAHFIITAQIKDTFLATKLVETFAVSARNIVYAHQIFNQINSPNSYSWTTLIRGYCEAKNPEKAVQNYRLMRSNGVEENRFTFVFVLKAYAMKLCQIEGKRIHGMVLKLGFDCDAFINNALINLYSKCEDFRSARKLFDEMPVNNVVNWNTLITACFSCGDLENARKLFDEMPERNVESWNAVIAGYCKLGQADVARTLFDEMEEKDLVSWASMISGYIQCGFAAKALELYKEMHFVGIKPDSVTITTALSACAQMGALDMGKWIHSHIIRHKLTTDVHLGTALVDMYAKCGGIDVAMQLFCDMTYRNICTWNALLSGLSDHGYGLSALELFREMKSYGVAPNDVTFVAVLSACSHVGAIDEGKEQFNRMQREFNITPKIEHYGCMVDILGRGGLVKEAKELIKSMPMKPNIVIWGAFLNACRIHGYMDIDDDIVSVLCQLASEDGGAYVLLSNIFVAKSDWNLVEGLRKKIRESISEKKTPGCSSIEVNSTVHEFFVEDRLHPKWVEINDVIMGLKHHSQTEDHT